MGYSRVDGWRAEDVSCELGETAAHRERRAIESVIHVLKFLLSREPDGRYVNVETHQSQNCASKLHGQSRTTYGEDDDDDNKTHRVSAEDICKVPAILLDVSVVQDQVGNAEGENADDAEREGQHEHEELANRVSERNLLVVATAHAGADPGAVVVELVHAVVAHVAVGSAEGSEDEAGFAELESAHLRGVHLLHSLVEYAPILAQHAAPVLFRHVLLLERPDSPRDYSRVRQGSSEQEVVDDDMDDV